MITMDELKTRKKELGLTYDELSTKSNIPKRTIQDYFQGITKMPRIDTMNALALALGLSLDNNIAPQEPIQVIQGEILTDKEKRLVNAYRNILPNMQDYLLEMAEGLAKRTPAF